MKYLVLVLSLIAGLILLPPKKAECSWCPSYACYNGGVCGSGCACLKIAGELQGRCVTLDNF